MQLSASDIKTIVTNELFRDTEPAAFEHLSSLDGWDIRRYNGGETVYSRRQFERSLGIILEGRLQVTKELADGKRIIMSSLVPGAMFGAAALFNDEPEYATTLTAVGKCRIIFFTQAFMAAAFQKRPELAERYIRYLSERILFLNRKIYLLSSGTAEQRLALHLLESMEAGASLSMPMVRLASALNISRASLYRALDALIAAHAVEKTDRSIVITDADALRSFIN